MFLDHVASISAFLFSNYPSETCLAPRFSASSPKSPKRVELCLHSSPRSRAEGSARSPLLAFCKTQPHRLPYLSHRAPPNAKQPGALLAQLRYLPWQRGQ